MVSVAKFLGVFAAQLDTERPFTNGRGDLVPDPDNQEWKSIGQIIRDARKLVRGGTPEFMGERVWKTVKLGKVFDVACADGIKPDPTTHYCAGYASVDLANCSISPDKGAVNASSRLHGPKLSTASSILLRSSIR